MDDSEISKLVSNLVDDMEIYPSTSKYVFNSSSNISRIISVIEPTQVYLIDAQFPVDSLKHLRMQQHPIVFIIVTNDSDTFDCLLENGNVIYVRTCTAKTYDNTATMICLMRLAMEISAMPFVKTILPCVVNNDPSVNEFIEQLKIVAVKKTIIPYVITVVPPSPALSPQPSRETSVITMTQLVKIHQELARILSQCVKHSCHAMLKATGIHIDKFRAWYTFSEESQLITAAILHWIIQQGYAKNIDCAIIGQKEQQNLLAYRELVIRSDQYEYRINAK